MRTVKNAHQNYGEILLNHQSTRILNIKTHQKHAELCEKVVRGCPDKPLTITYTC
ncbi:MAG: hypothetical protein ACP5GU_08205 [Thermoprotei archaeon]